MAVTFIQSVDQTEAKDYLVSVIGGSLDSGTDVLWLLSGGSNIRLAVEVAKGLVGIDLDDLTVMLADERFGTVGHPDSNWQQLMDAGFELPGATMVPTLMGLGLDESTRDYAIYLGDQLASDAYKVGLFGIGSDGHTAGILPGSPAVDCADMVAGYTARDHTRITMTARAIARLDEAVVTAFGPSKRVQLERLRTDLSEVQQPAQVLKAVPLRIFSDFKENAL